jgi:hypothetical protein
LEQAQTDLDNCKKTIRTLAKDVDALSPMLDMMDEDDDSDDALLNGLLKTIKEKMMNDLSKQFVTQ